MMARFRQLTIAVLTMAGTDTLYAQAAVLRPAASGRAVSEVTLAYPRPGGGMGAMPGMPAAAAPAGAPATPATTSDKPLVIRLDYGQPHLRGRALHTDSLVPWDRPWRTGANGLTTLTTDVDLVLGGAPLPKGTYVFYTLPGRAGWKLMVQRIAAQDPMQYDESRNVARIDLRHTTLPASLESFTMWLIPSREPGPARGELRFAWGTDQLSTDWSVR